MICDRCKKGAIFVQSMGGSIFKDNKALQICPNCHKDWVMAYGIACRKTHNGMLNDTEWLKAFKNWFNCKEINREKVVFN